MKTKKKSKIMHYVWLLLSLVFLSMVVVYYSFWVLARGIALVFLGEYFLGGDLSTWAIAILPVWGACAIGHEMNEYKEKKGMLYKFVDTVRNKKITYTNSLLTLSKPNMN